MKAREPRTKVLLPARMRWEGPWVAASVRNLSGHGMMLCSAAVPPIGTYVEVQVASQTITARAVWSADHTCGLLSRERLEVSRFLAPQSAGRRSAAAVDPMRAAWRHEHNDPRKSAERNRTISNLFQYCTAGLVAAAVAGSLGWEVYKTLSAPMSVIQSNLVQSK